MSGAASPAAARPDEAAAIAATIRAAFAPYAGRLEPESGALAETAESIACHLAAHPALVIRDGARIAACVLLERRPGELYLGRVAVDPDWRGQGLGTLLVAAAADRARAEGSGRLALRVRLALPGNIRFFERLGFLGVATEAHAGFDRPTTLVMHCNLQDAVGGGQAPVLRAAAIDDLPRIAALYGHFVLTGTASFEEVPPGLAEMRARFEAVQALGLPYRVAVVGGTVAGFAYAAPFRPRSAYRHTLEDSVYVAPDQAGKGIGRALLAEVIAACAALGYRQLVAAIGDGANLASIRLHRAAGFEPAGTCRDVGLKFGRWLDLVLMQRALNGGGETLPAAPPQGWRPVTG